MAQRITRPETPLRPEGAIAGRPGSRRVRPAGVPPGADSTRRSDAIRRGERGGAVGGSLPGASGRAARAALAAGVSAKPEADATPSPTRTFPLVLEGTLPVRPDTDGPPPAAPAQALAADSTPKTTMAVAGGEGKSTNTRGRRRAGAEPALPSLESATTPTSATLEQTRRAVRFTKSPNPTLTLWKAGAAPSPAAASAGAAAGARAQGAAPSGAAPHGAAPTSARSDAAVTQQRQAPGTTTPAQPAAVAPARGSAGAHSAPPLPAPAEMRRGMAKTPAETPLRSVPAGPDSRRPLALESRGVVPRGVSAPASSAPSRPEFAAPIAPRDSVTGSRSALGLASTGSRGGVAVPTTAPHGERRAIESTPRISATTARQAGPIREAETTTGATLVRRSEEQRATASGRGILPTPTGIHGEAKVGGPTSGEAVAGVAAESTAAPRPAAAPGKRAAPAATGVPQRPANEPFDPRPSAARPASEPLGPPPTSARPANAPLGPLPTIAPTADEPLGPPPTFAPTADESLGPPPTFAPTADEPLGPPPTLALPGDDLLGPPPSLLPDGDDSVTQPHPPEATHPAEVSARAVPPGGTPEAALAAAPAPPRALSAAPAREETPQSRPALRARPERAGEAPRDSTAPSTVASQPPASGASRIAHDRIVPTRTDTRAAASAGDESRDARGLSTPGADAARNSGPAGEERHRRIGADPSASGPDPAHSQRGYSPGPAPAATVPPSDAPGTSAPALTLPADDLLGPPPSLVQDGGDVVTHPLPAFPLVVPQETARRVGEQLLGALRAGDRQVELQLDPPHLGRLSLRLEVDGHDVSAHLVTGTAAARDLLDQQSGDLQRQLAEQGLRLTEFQVTLDPDAQSRSFEREAAAARFTPERPAAGGTPGDAKGSPKASAPNRVELGLNRIDLVA